MTKKTLKKYLAIVAFIAMAASFSSCNRGLGCPNNFSVDNSVVEIVKNVSNIFVNK